MGRVVVILGLLLLISLGGNIWQYRSRAQAATAAKGQAEALTQQLEPLRAAVTRDAEARIEAKTRRVEALEALQTAETHMDLSQLPELPAYTAAAEADVLALEAQVSSLSTLTVRQRDLIASQADDLAAVEHRVRVYRVWAWTATGAVVLLLIL